MNKYLRISLITTAIYIGLAFALYVLSDFFGFAIGRFGVGKVGRAAEEAVFWIPYLGMILTALTSAVTGLIAAYEALKTHVKWWHAITIYAAINALLVFGMGFSILVP